MVNPTDPPIKRLEMDVAYSGMLLDWFSNQKVGKGMGGGGVGGLEVGLSSKRNVIGMIYILETICHYFIIDVSFSSHTGKTCVS